MLLPFLVFFFLVGLSTTCNSSHCVSRRSISNSRRNGSHGWFHVLQCHSCWCWCCWRWWWCGDGLVQHTQFLGTLVMSLSHGLEPLIQFLGLVYILSTTTFDNGSKSIKTYIFIEKTWVIGMNEDNYLKRDSHHGNCQSTCDLRFKNDNVERAWRVWCVPVWCRLLSRCSPKPFHCMTMCTWP